MQRFTISLDDSLATQFDKLIAAKAYVNRSEAVRDLIRAQIDAHEALGTAADWSVATVSYIYDHGDPQTAARLLGLQHQHHDLVVVAQRTHLDHQDSFETVTLTGPAVAVRACAQALLALRGVRHGNINLVPLRRSGRMHTHTHSPQLPHVHHAPLS